jgi:DNA-directed RNA polymerase specialized sigma24 family protein
MKEHVASNRSTINAETSLLEKENAELIREALAELPLEYRDVLVLARTPRALVLGDREYH